MKLPSSSDIKSLLDEAKNLLPNVSTLVTTFNKDIKTKEVLKFASSFPIVVTTLAMCLKSITDVMENFDAKNLTSIRNKMGLMLLRDSNGKEIVDVGGNPTTIMTPFLSIVTSMTSAVDRFNIKSFLKLPMQLKMMKKTFDKVFDVLDKILQDNSTFFNKISTNKTVKEVLRDKGTSNEKTTVTEGTGGVFKEVSLIFTSMGDIATMLSGLAKRMPLISISLNKILKNRDKLIDLFSLLTGISNLFTTTGWNIGKGKTLKIDPAELKTDIKNWSQFDTVLQGVYNTFLWLGVKSVFMFIFFLPITWSLKAMNSIINLSKKLLKSINDPTFTKQLNKVSYTVMLMGSVLLLFASTLYVISKYVTTNFADIALGFIEVALFLSATYLLFCIIQRVGSPKNMIETWKSLGLIILAMLALVEMLIMISYIDDTMIAIGLAGIAGLTTIILAILGIFSLVKFSVEAIGGRLEILSNIGVVILGVLGLTVALWVINMMFEDVSAGDIILDLVILGNVVGMMLGIMWALGQMKPVSMNSIATIAVITLATIGIAYAIKLALEAVHDATLADIFLFTGITLGLIGLFVGVGMLASGPQAAIVGIGIALISAISVAVLALGHAIKTIVGAFGEIHKMMSDTSPAEMINELKMIPVLLFAFVGSILAIPLPIILLASMKATMLWFAMNPAISTISKMIKTIQDMADGQFEFNDPDNPGKKKTYNLIELFNNGTFDKIGDHLTTMILGFANAVASIPWTVALKVMCMEDMMDALDNMVSPISKMIGVITDIASGTVEVYDSTGAMTKMNLAQFLSSGYDRKIADTMTILLTGFVGAIASIPWSEIKKVENREDFLEELGECVGPVLDLFKMVSDLAKGTVEVDGRKVSLVGFIQSNQGNITNSIKSVILAFMDAMSMGMPLGKATDWWTDVFEEYMDAAKDGLEEVPKVISPLVNLITSVKDIALAINDTKKVADLSTVASDTREIINAVLLSVTHPSLQTFNPNGLNKTFSSLEELSVSLANITRNFSGVEGKDTTGFDGMIDTTARFINKVNTINVSKANSLANLFDKLAKLSESLDGNFDRLADAISDKLINVLAELNETMDDFSGKSTSLGDSIMNIGAGLLNLNSVGSIASSTNNFNTAGSQNSPDTNIREIKDTIKKLLQLASTSGLRTKQVSGLDYKSLEGSII